MEIHKNMNNREIAKLLEAIAASYEVKGESRFKVIAYDRAAIAVENTASELKDIWEEKKLESIPSIGKSIASSLDELFRTGKVKHFEKIMKGLPPAMFVLLDVPGIGAKTAWKLCENLNLKNSKSALKDLEKAAREGKIREVEGFGEESEKNILKEIEKLKVKEERILLPIAWEQARSVIDYMNQEKSVLRIDPLGSLRRMVATVGDIDLSVSTHTPDNVIDHFLRFSQIKEVVASGGNTVRVFLKSGFQVDLKTQDPSAYGAMLQHFTGSKFHNIHLREVAIKNGLSLSEYGIRQSKVKSEKFKVKSRLIKFKDEETFYRYLGMEWIPPELREDSGEIEAAQAKKLPNLVRLEDIKGDFHMHSDFAIEPSHDLGRNSMEEMIKKALERGYQYLAFSEHNPSISNHSEKQTIDLLKRKKYLIDKLNYSYKKSDQKIKLFNCLEVDIRVDGNLAISEKALDVLDFAIASVHASFEIDIKKMTIRILKALSHPKIKILGHPTGRKLNQREGFELDWEQIFTFCLKNKKYLEINSCSDRLDLPDFLVRDAVKKGVKIIIGSDAHSDSEMDQLHFGVSVARRGWAEKKDILNTLNCDKIENYLLL